jgi:di/tripeptidase
MGSRSFCGFSESRRDEDEYMDKHSISFMDALENLEPEPKDVFQYFRELSKIPRASCGTDQAAGYLLSFAEKRQLSCTVDACNNVVIVKPASKGMEGRPPIMLQAHMDMVVEVSEEAGKDPRTYGISTYTDGDWMKARGTTLGADDGIGCAMMLAILADDTLCHPKIEAVFTSDDEIGMKGAERMDDHILKALTARRCINLDTHDDGKLVLGSTGGMSVETVIPIKRKPVSGSIACRVSVRGLKGGHSGRDILSGRGNALMLLGRVIYELFHTAPLRLVNMHSSERLNVIPSHAEAEIVTTPQGVPRITEISEKLQEILSKEYEDTDPDLQIEVDIMDEESASGSAGGIGGSRAGNGTGTGGGYGSVADAGRLGFKGSAAERRGAVSDSFFSCSGRSSGASGRTAGRTAGADDSFWQKAAKKQVVMHTNTVVSAGTQLPPEPDVRIYRRVGEKESLQIPLDEKSTRAILSYFMCVPRGIIRMSPVYKGLPEVSTVTSQAELRRNEFHARGLIRSFSETRKYFLAERIETLAESLEGDIMTYDNYRAWNADPQSPLADAYEQAYKEETGESPERTAVPASLECGILCDHFGDDLDIISVGPTAENAHSVYERLSISSTEKTYQVLKRLLAEL